MAMIGLEKITGKILAEARAEAEQILADAEAECAKIGETYKARADRIRADIDAETEKKKQDLTSRAKSSAEMKKRNLILSAKGEMVNQIFDNVFDGILGESDEAYLALMESILAATLLEQVRDESTSVTLYGKEGALAPESYEVILNKKDRARCGEALVSGFGKLLIGKISSEKLSHVTLSEKTAAISGGFILKYGDMETNCSLDLIFAELREKYEIEVSHALFDKAQKA